MNDREGMFKLEGDVMAVKAMSDVINNVYEAAKSLHQRALNDGLPEPLAHELMAQAHDGMWDLIATSFQKTGKPPA